MKNYCQLKGGIEILWDRTNLFEVFVAIKRTPHYDVWSAPPRALNIGAVRITALAPAPPHQKV